MFSILNSDLCFDTYHGFISLEDSLMPDNREPWDTHDPDNFEDDMAYDDWDGEYPGEDDGQMESDLFDDMMDNDLDD